MRIEPNARTRSSSPIRSSSYFDDVPPFYSFLPVLQTRERPKLATVSTKSNTALRNGFIRGKVEIRNKFTRGQGSYR